MKQRAAFLMVALLAMLMAGVARADVFPAVADIFVDESHPNTAYGRKDFMRTDDSPRKVILLRFPQEAITAESAWVFLDVLSGGANLAAHEAKGAWDEATVTWNTRPSYGFAETGLFSISLDTYYPLNAVKGKENRPHRRCLKLKQLPESIAIHSGGTLGRRQTRYLVGRAFALTNGDVPVLGLLDPSTYALLDPLTGLPV